MSVQEAPATDRPTPGVTPTSTRPSPTFSSRSTSSLIPTRLSLTRSTTTLVAARLALRVCPATSSPPLKTSQTEPDRDSQPTPNWQINNQRLTNTKINLMLSSCYTAPTADLTSTWTLHSTGKILTKKTRTRLRQDKWPEYLDFNVFLIVLNLLFILSVK